MEVHFRKKCTSVRPIWTPLSCIPAVQGFFSYELPLGKSFRAGPSGNEGLLFGCHLRRGVLISRRPCALGLAYQLRGPSPSQKVGVKTFLSYASLSAQVKALDILCLTLLLVIPSLKVFTFHINIVHIPMEKSKDASQYCHFFIFWGDRNVFVLEFFLICQN